MPNIQMDRGEAYCAAEMVQKVSMNLFHLESGSTLDSIVKATNSSRLHLPFSAKEKTTNFSEAPFKPAGGERLIFNG